MRCLVLFAVLALPVSGWAQDANGQRFAEIRAELELLKGQIQTLRNELITATPAETGVANAAPLMVRVDQMEEELRDLTGQVEQLGFRLDAVIADGTNRIGDLEFRLTELEGGDFSTLGETRPLGQDTPVAAPQSAPLAVTGTQTATIEGVGEAATSTLRPRLRPGAQNVQDTSTQVAETPTTQTVATAAPADFETALGAYRAGQYAQAVTGFETYIQAQPTDPRVPEAAFWKGEALAAQGSWNLAARSYLDAFSGNPQGIKAPEALLRLGVSLGRLGQFQEACLTLGEVGKRFPQAGGDLAQRTESELRALNCS